MRYHHPAAVREAAARIAAVQARLPEPLAASARALGCHYARSCTRPGDEDILGVYHDLDQSIVLYLETIWDYAQEEGGSFWREVEDTYLHELGHALGLEEEDLEARGL